MNILMMSNTYLPHVGGVARSVDSFTRAYRRLGHRVLVVAPEFENVPPREREVVRVPAIQHFNGSDFSMIIPIPFLLTSAVDEFNPDLVHSHHPYLMGGVARRVAHLRDVPLVFTHHTMYEHYTHYVPGDSPILRRFVISLSTSYANLSDAVIAPSESVAELLRERGVTKHISVVPTGVDLRHFGGGDGAAWRRRAGITPESFVVGHVGRLAPEKNLEFLAEAAALFLRGRPDSCFAVVGGGPSEKRIREIFGNAGLAGRLHLTGPLERERLPDAYHAMDVFAFASRTETQGIVVTEAMAAGVPVVAVEAPGVREVVEDTVNGRLIQEEDRRAFAEALGWVASLEGDARDDLHRRALETASRFAIDRTAGTALDIYEEVKRNRPPRHHQAHEAWEHTLDMIKGEWELLRDMAERTAAEEFQGQGRSGE